MSLEKMYKRLFSENTVELQEPK